MFEKKRILKKACALVFATTMVISNFNGISFNANNVYADDVVYEENDVYGYDREYDNEYTEASGSDDMTEVDMEEVPDELKIDTVEDYYESVPEEESVYEDVDRLPKEVDNSKSIYFPEISSQGSTPSCTAWAQVYYQFTYTFNKKNNIRTNSSNTFAPLFNFNFCNRGSESMGSTANGIYDNLCGLGALTTRDYKNTTDLLKWELSEELLNEASNNRVSSYQFIGSEIGEEGHYITSNDDEDLDVLKTALANGEILCATTYSRAWARNQIKANDEFSGNRKYKDEYIIKSLFDTAGSHRVTIVGYDDDIWCDVNENGEVDAGEMGAFKIANSWGKYAPLHNKGFLWVAYDALNLESQVKDVIGSRARALTYITRIEAETKDDDSDIKLAFTLNTKYRYRGGVVVCVYDESDEMIGARNLPFFCTDISGNTISYDGDDNVVDGTFSIDLDRAFPDITSEDLSRYKITARVYDTKKDGVDTLFKGMKVVDYNTNKVYEFSDFAPVSFDGNSRTYTLNNTPIENKIKIYYSGFDTSYIHYCPEFGSFTPGNGYLMERAYGNYNYTHVYTIDLNESGYANVCFNDGHGNWDSRNGYNYKFYPGTYGLKNGKISIISEAENIMPDSTNNITIYYIGFDNPNIHYQVGNRNWTDVPGIPMESTSEMQGFSHVYTIELGDSNYANVCFNDGHGNWDSRYGQNYYFEKGCYTYSNGTITKIN